MTMAAFDTLKAVKRLKEAGLDEAQAEAMVETFGGPPHDSLATREDLAATEEKLRADITATETVLRTEIAGTEEKLRTEIAHSEERLTLRIDAQSTEIAHTEEKLRGEIAQVRTEIQAATAALGKELFRAMFVMAFAIVGLTVTLIRLLP